MSRNLPQWAIVRAEEARTMADGEDRGPWVGNHMCANGSPGVMGSDDTIHPAEEPYFFHCKACIARLRRRQKIKPNARREQGLCSCGEPANAKRDVLIMPNAAAMQAEQQDTTIARLTTRQFCTACDPTTGPFCSAAMCRDKKRHKAICTTRHSHTIVHHHCAFACSVYIERRRREDRRRRGRNELAATTDSAARRGKREAG